MKAQAPGWAQVSGRCSLPLEAPLRHFGSLDHQWPADPALKPLHWPKSHALAKRLNLLRGIGVQRTCRGKGRHRNVGRRVNGPYHLTGMLRSATTELCGLPRLGCSPPLNAHSFPSSRPLPPKPLTPTSTLRGRIFSLTEKKTSKASPSPSLPTTTSAQTKSTIGVSLPSLHILFPRTTSQCPARRY